MIRELRFQHALVPFYPRPAGHKGPPSVQALNTCYLGSPLLITILPSDLLVLPAKQPHVPSEPIQLFAFAANFNDPDIKTFFFICLGTELNRETMIGMPEMLMLGPKVSSSLPAPPLPRSVGFTDSGKRERAQRRTPPS